MPNNDLAGVVLFAGFYVVAAGVPLVLLRAFTDVPFEVSRKVLHVAQTLSILLLFHLFSSWAVAILVALGLVLTMYPVLAILERLPIYRRIAVERGRGDFRRQLIYVQATYALLIFVFWGVLGPEWRFVPVAAVMGWGFGDAAAALVGKAIGRHRIPCRGAAGKKTVEGSVAMVVVAGLAVFLTLLVYASQPAHISLTAALLVAPVCAIVELFTPGGLDTVTVPLSAGLWLMSLMSAVTAASM